MSQFPFQLSRQAVGREEDEEERNFREKSRNESSSSEPKLQREDHIQ